MSKKNLLSPILKHYQKFQTTLTEYNCVDGQTLNYEFLFNQNPTKIGLFQHVYFDYLGILHKFP